MEALGKRTDGIRGAGAALARWHLGQARASMATATSLQPAGEELDRVERSLKTKPAGKAGASQWSGRVCQTRALATSGLRSFQMTPSIR